MNYLHLNKKSPAIKPQRGIGLIELMVSIAIGLFLLLGLATSFFNMKNTSTSRQGLAELQNKERLTTTYIANAIRTAGQFTQPCVTDTTVNCTTQVGDTFLAASPFLAGQVMSGTQGSSAGTDTVSTRFASIVASDVVGCGAPTTAGKVYTDTFSIDGTGNLICTETPDGGVAQSYTLGSGLAGMQVLYGVGLEDLTDPDAINSVARYFSASNMTADYWNQVRTVNVMLAFIPATKTTCTLPSTWPATWATSATNKCVVISRIVGLAN